MPPVPDRIDRPAELHLVFRADPASIRRSLAGMMNCPPLSGLKEDARGMVELVLAETLNNVAEHAYGEKGGPVEITLRWETAGIRCLIVDEGRAMPGGTLPEGRLPVKAGSTLQDLPEGGFGWHLIRALCSELSYIRSADRNHLMFLLPV